MLLMIDNYDSFTYNVVQYLAELGADVQVYRNDEITIEQIEELNPERLVISPGPCTPNEAGISMEAIRHFAGKLPILGICLGHQAIGQVYGGDVIRAGRVMHGKVSRCSQGHRRIPEPEQPAAGDPLPQPGHRQDHPAGLPGSDRLDPQ